MNLIGFSIIFAFSMLIYFMLGVLASRQTNSSSEFTHAGRSMGFWPTTMSLIGIQLGGGMLFGGSEAAYENGLIGLFYSLGLGLSLITMAFFGSKQLRQMEVKTISEIFEKTYGSIFLKKFTSIISILGLAGLFVAQIIASKKFLAAIGVGELWVLLLMWCVIIGYTMLGGIRATAYSDIIQVCIILLVFVAVIFFIPIQDVNFNKQTLLKNFDSSDVNYASLLIAPYLFCFIEQDVAQRFFSCKSVKIAKFSALTAGIFIILFGLIPVYVGLYAQNFEISTNESPLMFALNMVSNGFFMPIIAIAILAAIISTGDGPLCAIISNVMSDFNIDKQANSLLKARSITLLIGILSIIIALSYDNVLGMLIHSYQLIICTMFVPVFFSFFASEKLSFCKNSKSATFAVMVGSLAYFTSFAMPESSLMPKEFFAIFLSLMAFVLSGFFKFRDCPK